MSLILDFLLGVVIGIICFSAGFSADHAYRQHVARVRKSNSKISEYQQALNEKHQLGQALISGLVVAVVLILIKVFAVLPLWLMIFLILVILFELVKISFILLTFLNTLVGRD